jgi:hypothetical protein
MSVCQKVLRLMYLFKCCEEPKGTDELAILLCTGNPTQEIQMWYLLSALC